MRRSFYFFADIQGESIYRVLAGSSNENRARPHARACDADPLNPQGGATPADHVASECITLAHWPPERGTSYRPTASTTSRGEPVGTWHPSARRCSRVRGCRSPVSGPPQFTPIRAAASSDPFLYVASRQLERVNLLAGRHEQARFDLKLNRRFR
jgi:hypothetical protein